MKYKINPKLKGRLTIPSIKNAVFKAGDTITLTEEQIIDKYISTAIKKDIIQIITIETPNAKTKKEKIVEKVEPEKNAEKTTNSGAWDADNKKLLDVTESAKKTLEDLDIKDTMNVQSHDINLDLSEEKPTKKKKGRPKTSKSLEKAKTALDKAVKDIEKPKAIDRKKKEEILDLDRLTEEKNEDADFVFDNSKNDKIDFVDLEQDRKRSRQNNTEVK